VRGKLGSGKKFTVKAEAIVVSAGALMTPVLLKKAGVCKETPFLGKNLSIHPASKVMALFGENIDMASAIPQGYCVDQFEGEGLMLEGASTPLDVTAVAIPWVGHRYTEVMERFRHLATFGFMIEDTSRGEVRPGPNGLPLILYNLNDNDVRRMARGVSILAELFLAAGADRVMTFLPGAPEVYTADGARAIAGMKLKAMDFEVTAYHPLGTARIGTDPKTSVCGPDHETHEVESLYIVDGGSVPSALGVNPQMTIMAMALRAGELLDARLG
jgi:choline dehydrogenase-like flavoprotein